MELVSLERGPLEIVLPTCATVCVPKGKPQDTRFSAWFWIPGLQICENKSVVYKPCSSWQFVRAAWRDLDKRLGKKSRLHPEAHLSAQFSRLRQFDIYVLTCSSISSHKVDKCTPFLAFFPLSLLHCVYPVVSLCQVLFTCSFQVNAWRISMAGHREQCCWDV